MVAIVDISRGLWPSARWGRVAAYARSRGAIMDAAAHYAETLAGEVAAAPGGAPSRGRALMGLGHGLGWGGLALSLYGLLGVQRADIEHLLLGPFGIGLLMQIPSGALVRAGRRLLRPVTDEPGTVDKRRPVVLLGVGDSGSLPTWAWSVSAACEEYGPVINGPRPDQTAWRPGTGAAPFGEADWQAVLARVMDQAVLVAVVPDAGFERVIEIAARRRHAHKLLVLLPPHHAMLGTHRDWTAIRTALESMPDFAGLPGQAPPRLAAVHLSTSREPVLLTGPDLPRAGDYHRLVAHAIYGMKCHGRS